MWYTRDGNTLNATNADTLPMRREAPEYVPHLIWDIIVPNGGSPPGIAYPASAHLQAQKLRRPCELLPRAQLTATGAMATSIITATSKTVTSSTNGTRTTTTNSATMTGTKPSPTSTPTPRPTPTPTHYPTPSPTSTPAWI